jgi:hypothetical protein
VHLRTSTGGGGDCDQGTEGLVDGKTFANGCVDKVEQLGIGVAGEEVGDLLRTCGCRVSLR